MPQTGVAGSWATSSWSQLTNHEAPESAYLPGGRALLRGLAEQEADLLEGPRECVSGCHVSGSAPRFVSLPGLLGVVVNCWIGGVGRRSGRALRKCRRVTSVVGTDWRWTFRELHDPCTRLVQRYHSTCRPLTRGRYRVRALAQRQGGTGVTFSYLRHAQLLPQLFPTLRLTPNAPLIGPRFDLTSPGLAPRDTRVTQDTSQDNPQLSTPARPALARRPSNLPLEHLLCLLANSQIDSHSER